MFNFAVVVKATPEKCRDKTGSKQEIAKNEKKHKRNYFKILSFLFLQSKTKKELVEVASNRTKAILKQNK